MPTPLNIGLIGYGFMGRAHSNAYRKVNQFFTLDYHPVMKAACARGADKIQAFADSVGPIHPRKRTKASPRRRTGAAGAPW